MIKKQYSLFFILLLLLPVFSSAQNNREIDSLKTLLPKLAADTGKVVVLNLLSRYIVDIDPDKSIEYSTEAFAIAKNKNHKTKIILFISWLPKNPYTTNTSSLPL